MPPSHPDVLAARLPRRTLLRGVLGAGTLLGSGALLAACSGDDDSPVLAGAPTRSVVEPDDPVLTFLNETLGLELTADDVTLNVAFASFEVLTGTSRVPFGLFDLDREAVLDLPAQAWLLAQSTREVAAGPVPAPFYGEGLGDRGVYVPEAELSTTGVHLLVVEAGGVYGFTAVQVRDPADSIVPIPGEELAPLPTPTADDLLGLATLCTRTPPCPLHERSFADIRAAGRPAVVSVATPAFCASAICAPTVDLLTRVHEDLGDDELDWVHAEVFVDAGETPAPYVGADGWGLPTEPWTFVVAADGTIVDRFDGPLVEELLRDAIGRATA